MISLVDVSRLQECLRLAQHRCVAQKSSVLASFSMPWCGSEFRSQTHLEMVPVAFLSANFKQVHPLCFWASPQPRTFTVGMGAALELELKGSTEQSWSALQTQWLELLRGAVIDGEHQPALLGGFSFDKVKTTSPLWQDFPAAALTLPQFSLLTQTDDGELASEQGTNEQTHGNQAYRHTLVINCLVDEQTDCHGVAYQLAAQWQMLVARVARLNAKDDDSDFAVCQSNIEASTADKDIWQSRVASAVEAIHSDVMQKVVLARGETLNVDCCPGELLNDLAKRFPQAYLFAFYRGNSCFLGASPERLLSCEQGQIATVALAGSAPRGATEQADRQFGEALFNSEKDRLEHDMVVQHLHGILSEHCQIISVPSEPMLHKLAQIQHLLTPLHGEAKGEVVLLDVLESMHPSAAVGGLPRSTALDYIREHENLDRGWYAAPVGWLDANGDGEFAVALRSALITKDGHHGLGSNAVSGAKSTSNTAQNPEHSKDKSHHVHNSITLFAGCGIVAASNPVHEYRESSIKMNAIREAIRNVTRVPEVAE